jgi:NIPSNAP protein
MRLRTLVLVLASFIVSGAYAADAGHRVFEIRTYTTPDGKLEELNKRFREHTTKLFERHGMVNIGYWMPQDPPLAGHTLVYILAHKSRDAAKKSWDEFGADPEWQKVKAASEANGPIVTKVESVFVEPTDYSPLK